MVATNIGNVPIEDYREIVATQNGFDSDDEMYNEGIRIGNGYDKEPEPIVPAWEQKKKSKVKSFDLHPDIPMAERHNFDLANNQVEEVNKKERFHRNYAAIKVLRDCQNENRFATPDEQKILSRYVGWGGIPEAFDERAGRLAYRVCNAEKYPDAGGICVGKRKHLDRLLHSARSIYCHLQGVGTDGISGGQPA